LKERILGKKYASGLLSIGLADKNYGAYEKILTEVAESFSDENNMRFITSPLISLEQRKDVIAEIAKQYNLPLPINNLLMVLLESGRFKFLPYVAQAYRELVDETSGIVTANILSVAPLEEPILAQLREKLSKKLNKKVTLINKIDPSLIGGIRTEVGSLVIDGSIRGYLDSLRETLKKR